MYKKYTYALIVVLAVWGFFSLLNDNLCYFKVIFGMPCPGCGMTRAYISLFQFDLKTAFYYNPLFWMIPIIAIVIIFRKKFNKIYCNKYFWISILTIFFITYIIRMIMYFPDTPPMDYNENSIWGYILNLIRKRLLLN